MPSNVEKIFTLYGKYISHVWIDTHTHRYKFYITLYHLSFQEWLRILTDCRKILGIASEYKLEKNFQKFDCIWFDIFQDGSTAMKIYELCDVPQIDFSVLPSSISYDNIKEVGFLKDFTGRKKMFFRCIFPIDISVFEDSFDFSSFDVFVKDIKDFYDVQKKVTYYCIEAENQEIYFM